MSDQSLEDMGGTQRLGDYECQLNPGTHAYRLYGKKWLKKDIVIDMNLIIIIKTF